MAHIKVTGLEELEKKLKKDKTLTDVKKTVRKNGSELQDKIQRNADFRGHWGYVPGKGRAFIPPTGALKGSVRLEITDGGFTAESGPTKEYGEYVEYGTRFMDAQEFVKPALEAQAREFESDMKELVR
jgi:HK97 gp10 family phage protein